MRNYDVLIIGGATSGAYFAKKTAKLGHSVKIIEKLSPEKLGTKMDIVHLTKTDLRTFDIPTVHEGDSEWAFEFTDNGFASPSNSYRFPVPAETVGLHLHEYTALMVKEAVEAGAEIEYEASFREFIFTDGHISGVRYETPGGEKEVYAKAVVDCSGASALPRRSLPNGYGIERFALADDDMFYVILRYARFNEPQENTFWLNTKSWYAPFSMNGNEKIIGTGAVCGYERAESEAAKLDSVTSHGDFELVKTEKGITPFRRPPYSLVADNFIIAGDSACLTKPDCGEGITSSMVMIDIAVKVLDEALKKDDLTKESLWEINRAYNRAQGADFSLVRAFLTKLIGAVTDDELEYLFSQGLIFNSKFLGGEKLTAKDAVQTVTGIITSVPKKYISGRTIAAALSGMKLGLELRTLYLNFPKNPGYLPLWSARAEKLWQKVGKVK